MIPATVCDVHFSESKNEYAVVLKEIAGKSTVRILIGESEARAIRQELHATAYSPTTHDVLKNIMDIYHAKIVKVLINQLKDTAFYATITLQAGETRTSIYAQPGDAIALALKTHASIFVGGDALNFENEGHVKELERQLYMAVALENYERAAELRDELYRIKNQKH
ncbi:bifunctional nuclease family protein [bacterium]|nr:bifunctional nuclease family protein [bacterium]